jgi:hypothetical protein
VTKVSVGPKKIKNSDFIVTAKKPRRRRGYHSDSDSDSSSAYSSDYSSDEEETGPKSKSVSEMIIHSKHLKAALSAVVSYYPGADFVGQRVTVPAPYRVLIHHRDALNQYKTNQPACHDDSYRETTVKHINLLLDFLDSTYREQLRDEERRHRNNPPAATFDWLWLLLKPGEVIYVKKDDAWRPFILSACKSVRTHSVKPYGYEIECWNVSFRRNVMHRRMMKFEIRSFAGEQAIHSLNIIPARFFPENLEKQGGLPMAQHQIEMGKMYWELCKRSTYKEYDGPLKEKGSDTPGTYKGRVIVDAEGYDLHGNFNQAPFRGPPRGVPPGMHHPPPSRDHLPAFAPRCSCKVCSAQTREEPGQFADFEDLNPKTDAAPKSNLYYTACSSTVPAFLLSERRWGYVNVDLLKEVKADREAFKYLVLEDEIKLTVKALIGKFASEDGKVSPWPRDLVKNKGEGRIFLLHGSPGVGKTCTAECVAELTHRPLLSLTSGDISTNMTAPCVERNLNHFLALGERYGALVLLDEADVYLEERRTKDLARNGLVSIFLRALEYYRGVLFLTTNRVEAFDSAFTSRIHVALHYRRLSDEDRMRIWTNNFERLERDSAGKVYVSRSARDYALGGSDEARALRWNGREIRNGLQTAVALAETEAMDDGTESVTVTDKHLQAVVRMSKGFKDFLQRKRGYDVDESDTSDSEDDSISSIVDD